MNDRTIVGSVAAVAVLIALVFFGSESASRSDFGGDHSTHSGTPEGSRAVYLLMERLGYKVDTWTLDLEQVDVDGTLVLIEPVQNVRGWSALFQPKGFTEQERDAAWEWVARGNRLVVLTSTGNDLLGDLGVQVGDQSLFSKKDDDASDGVSDPDESDKEEALDSSPSGENDGEPAPVSKVLESTEPEELRLAMESRAWWPGLNSVRVERKDKVGLNLRPIDTNQSKIILPHHKRVLLEDADGTPVGIEAAVGSGQVVVIAASDLLSNRGIGRAKNAHFVARLLGDSRGIWFDEYRHGYKKTRSLSDYLMQTGLWVVVAQLIFAMGFLFVRAQQRFGALVVVGDERDSSDSIQALAQLYLHGGHHHHALEVLLARYKRRLAAVYRVADGDEHDFVEHLGRVSPDDAALYRSLRARVIEGQPRELVELARELLSAIAATTKGGKA